jgi:Protein of Unknown function (DUF2784)
MLFRLLADATVVLHLAFVLFVVLGALLVVRRPRLAWIHLPAVVWSAWIEFSGWSCPLTPFENWLREQGGGVASTASFVDQYVIPVVYPASLSRHVQWLLGVLVLGVNALAYLFVWRRLRARNHGRGGDRA